MKQFFNQICSLKNLNLAFYNASKHKRSSGSYLYFRKKLEVNVYEIQKSLLDFTFEPGSFRQFKISDPKERLISAAPFKDRIVHHAIINVLECVFEKTFIFHTYACRKNKGTHAALKYVQKMCCKNFYINGGWKKLYFLKLDVRKYFDSINHDILKLQLLKLIKESETIFFLNKIIDSYFSPVFQNTEKGIPIGNLTSQYFANLYLSGLDHFILEKLKPKAYLRYMDDMLIFSQSVTNLKEIYGGINKFVTEQLKLELKQPVYGKCDCGVPFLGKLVTARNIRPLSEKIRLKKKKVKKIDYLVKTRKLSEEKASERITAILNDASWNGK